MLLKEPIDKNNLIRKLVFTKNARTAWSSILKNISLKKSSLFPMKYKL